MEALCILLTEKHPNPRRRSLPGQRRVFTSRWKLVLSEYNSIRDRIFNSQALLDETSLALYAINETTLVAISNGNLILTMIAVYFHRSNGTRIPPGPMKFVLSCRACHYHVPVWSHPLLIYLSKRGQLSHKLHHSSLTLLMSPQTLWVRRG